MTVGIEYLRLPRTLAVKMENHQNCRSIFRRDIVYGPTPTTGQSANVLTVKLPKVALASCAVPK